MMEKFGIWFGEHWGEAAAFALVALAALHLTAKFIFRKKSGACCENKGCAAIGSKKAVDNPKR